MGIYPANCLSDNSFAEDDSKLVIDVNSCETICKWKKEDISGR